MEKDIQFKHSIPVQIRFSDVDQFGHVNNSVYFSLYDLAKTTYVNDVLGDIDWGKIGIVVANINANFLSPVFFNDDIQIQTRTVRLGNTSFTLQQRAVLAATGEVKCECRTVMVLYDTAALTPISIPQNYKEDICKYEGTSIEMLSAQ